MPENKPIPELVKRAVHVLGSKAELARRLFVSRQAVDHWCRKHGPSSQHRQAITDIIAGGQLPNKKSPAD